MVGIVILNYNSWADTVACVDSIHEAEKKLEFRIYLVDNCSPVRPCLLYTSPSPRDRG